MLVLLIGLSLRLAMVDTAEKSHEKPNNKQSSNQESTNESELSEDSATTSPTDSSNNDQSSDSTKTYDFISDRDNWLARQPEDKSYSISFGPSETYGVCNGNKSTLLVGMIYMNTSNVYDCDSVSDALSSSNPILSRVGFGILDNYNEVKNYEGVTVLLPNNISAIRYEYTTVRDAVTYKHIQYVMDENDKTYTAHLRWEDGFDIDNGSVISPSYFDTIVQKTWHFN